MRNSPVNLYFNPTTNSVITLHRDAKVVYVDGVKYKVLNKQTLDEFADDLRSQFEVGRISTDEFGRLATVYYTLIDIHEGRYDWTLDPSKFKERIPDAF